MKMKAFKSWAVCAVLIAIIQWSIFVFLISDHPSGIGIILFFIVISCFTIGVPIFIKDTLFFIPTTAAAFDNVLLLFSVLYWQYGSKLNFNIKLSRFDAIYFTLGTLSTAGTGNIVAISETARVIQALQMGVDIGLMVLLVGILVSRIAK
jgi:hypothetical protein